MISVRVFRSRFPVFRAFSTEACNKDIYGPPDPKSSLRLISFYIPADETASEKEYRLKRAQVQDWNQEFWTAHNVQFIQAKEKFITSFMERGAKDSCTTGQQLTTDDLSEFYRSFLDENREKHLKYNMEWHMKNLSLLWPGIKANLSRLKKQMYDV